MSDENDKDDAPLVFLGVDIETTGSSFVPNIKTIQLGAFDPKTRDIFREDVGWGEGVFIMDPEATAVHGISRERILAAPSARNIDEQLYAWLTEHGAKPRRVIPIGFNVGAFDMPFVRRDFPKSATLFSYRTADLNAICFALGAAHEVDWRRFKTVAKSYAKACASGLVPDLKEHDAAYDAVEAWFCYEYLVGLVRNLKGLKELL